MLIMARQTKLFLTSPTSSPTVHKAIPNLLQATRHQMSQEISSRHCAVCVLYCHHAHAPSAWIEQRDARRLLRSGDTGRRRRCRPVFLSQVRQFQCLLLKRGGLGGVPKRLPSRLPHRGSRHAAHHRRYQFAVVAHRHHGFGDMQRRRRMSMVLLQQQLLCLSSRSRARPQMHEPTHFPTPPARVRVRAERVRLGPSMAQWRLQRAHTSRRISWRAALLARASSKTTLQESQQEALCDWQKGNNSRQQATWSSLTLWAATQC